nr:putative transmembrane protein (PGPGW) [uncultured bacterium]
MILAKSLRQIKKVIIFVVGMTVLLFGIALIVLPGPAFVVIPAGLAILSIEFAWARIWLQKARDMASKAGDKIRGKKKAENSEKA